jgi:predicted RNase H-like HicB family nuclease
VPQAVDVPVLCYQTGDGWVAFSPTLPAAHGSGPTAQDATQELERAIIALLDDMTADELADHLADIAERGPILAYHAQTLTIPGTAAAARRAG